MIISGSRRVNLGGVCFAESAIALHCAVGNNMRERCTSFGWGSINTRSTANFARITHIYGCEVF